MPASSRFAELGLIEGLTLRLSELGIDTPTPIQDQAIPVILDGRDILGLAQTGTGKTAAYLLPLLQLISRREAEGPRRPAALILAPTRELAHQVAASIKDFSRGMTLRYVVICGGERYSGQVAALKKGVDIIVATPGRFEDLQSQGVIDLGAIDHLILDEADQMIDLGFYPAITRICKTIESDRQTIFFSATMPDEMQRLVDEFLTDSVTIRIKNRNITADTVRQRAILLSDANKRQVLTDLLADTNGEQALVFVGTKRQADNLAAFLNAQEYSVDVLHGDMRQMIRTKVLKKFKTGSLQVLVATDVAARGIDVTGLNWVINYDLPQVPEIYVHRIGRTGRAHQEGVAISLCSPSQRRLLQAISRHIKGVIEIVNAKGEPASLDSRPEGKSRPPRGRQSRKPHPAKKAAKPRKVQLFEMDTPPEESRPGGDPGKRRKKLKGRPGGRPGGKPGGRKPFSKKGAPKKGGSKNTSANKPQHGKPPRQNKPPRG